MKKNFPVYAFVIGIVFILEACFSAPLNLSIAKEEVIKYHESGRYDKEAGEAVDKAINEFKNIQAGKKDIVVFDIDETALSNYAFNKEYDFGYAAGLWSEWINKAEAPAVEQVKRLYDYLISRGFGIVFLTGRKDYEYKATYKNLINAGYTKFDTLIVRNPSEYEMTALDYKSKNRTGLANRGFNIAGDVGDQYSDLEGPFHGVQVKIPNYQYIIK